MDTEQKLNILADSSKFDLACACKTSREPGRVRGGQGRWIYPAALPSGRKVFLLKTLQSNICVNDCRYCPFNNKRDLPRMSLGPDELAQIFIQMVQAKRVTGLFLSSGVERGPDQTMARMIDTVEILRNRYKFHGFIHLKIIPGASRAAVERAVGLAQRVSVNIEAPNAHRLCSLSSRKRFHEDIISTMRAINYCRKNINRKCHQTTQFVVGAAGETDREIVQSTSALYRKMEMERVYFSAYQDLDLEPKTTQPMLFDDIPARSGRVKTDVFMREHRLYQVDFLLRKYQFPVHEIDYDSKGNLSLERDPKQVWADKHPDFFPLDVHRADSWQLLRVPGIGPVGASRIIKARRQGRIRDVDDLRAVGVRRAKLAEPYLTLKS